MNISFGAIRFTLPNDGSKGFIPSVKDANHFAWVAEMAKENDNHPNDLCVNIKKGEKNTPLAGIYGNIYTEGGKYLGTAFPGKSNTPVQISNRSVAEQIDNIYENIPAAIKEREEIVKDIEKQEEKQKNITPEENTKIHELVTPHMPHGIGKSRA
ncbi:MAG: hypothetical protein A2Y25_03275 [Candidatus Melainabacteria bacterium GWF2_37_15]|nr:MAG: hypothetical protein A2Y25_03275 [Candidatus Melainabacteria bacterium GWF2_37_15]